MFVSMSSHPLTGFNVLPLIFKSNGDSIIYVRHFEKGYLIQESSNHENFQPNREF